MLNQTVKRKRATSQEPIFLDAKLFVDLADLINKIDWPYKGPLKEDLVRRDKALFAFMVLTGCRVSEALNIKAKQFRIYPLHIEIANIVTLKRGLIRKRIILPKKGSFKGLTLTVQDWLTSVDWEPDFFIFPRANTKWFAFKHHINRHRAYQVISLSGKFPHWARAVYETIYARSIFKNNAYKLKEFMGLKWLESTSPYVQGSWEENEKEIYKL
jgi:integrase